MSPTISLQLYSMNAVLESDLDGGLARVAEIGFNTVEVLDFVSRVPELRAGLDRHGIAAKTGHAFLASEQISLPDGTVVTAPSRADVFAAAKVLGLDVVIDPFVGADDRVVLELDLYWAAAAGLDAPALIERLGERIAAVHVKDGPMRDGISTADVPNDQTPAGQGDVPLAAALAAAPHLRYAVIEFDKQQGDIFEAVAASHAWLSAHFDKASG